MLDQSTIVRTLATAQPAANPDRSSNEDRARQLVATHDIDADQQPETDAASVSGTRDLRSFASPREAGLELGAELTLKVGDGTWVKVQFEASQRISVTKDGMTTFFTYPDAGGTWPDSLVRAFNSIGGGLNASLTSEGKLNLAAEDGQAIEIDSDPWEGLAARPSTATALGLDPSLINAGMSDREPPPRLGGLLPGFANALSGVFGLMEGDKTGNHARVMDAYAESTSLASSEADTETSDLMALDRFAPDVAEPALGII